MGFSLGNELRTAFIIEHFFPSSSHMKSSFALISGRVFFKHNF